jgi:hypothetical protein
LLCLVQDPQRAGTGATGAESREAVVVVGLPSPDTPGEYRDTPDYHLLAEVQTHEAVVGCGMIIQRELRQIIAEASFTSELNLRSCAVPRRPIPPVDRLEPRRERRADE